MRALVVLLLCSATRARTARAPMSAVAAPTHAPTALVAPRRAEDDGGGPRAATYAPTLSLARRRAADDAARRALQAAATYAPTAYMPSPAPAPRRERGVAKMQFPQVFVLVFWTIGLLAALAAPAFGVLRPRADEFDDDDGAPRRAAELSFVRGALRPVLPYAEILLDAMQVASYCFLPSVRWDGDATFADAMRAWCWGLYWRDGTSDLQGVLLLVACGVLVFVSPCACFAGSNPTLARLLTSTLARTLFHVLFSGLACSEDGEMTSGLTLAKWGRLSRGGKCDKGVPELLAALGCVGAVYYLLLCVVAGVRRLRDEDHPRGTYAHVYDTFFGRALLAFVAAQYGFSTRRQHGEDLLRLVIAVSLLSLLVQAIARPLLRSSRRQHTLRLSADLFQLGVACAVAAGDRRALHGARTMHAAFVAAGVLAFMSLFHLCCCCVIPRSRRKATVRDAFECCEAAPDGFDPVVMGGEKKPPRAPPGEPFRKHRDGAGGLAPPPPAPSGAIPTNTKRRRWL